MQNMEYFPHEKIRDIQDELINFISKSLSEKKNSIIHAPTGLGKTAAALAPALGYAKENNLCILFLTSRHTQHKIVIDTVRQIKEKGKYNVLTADIIGKQHMCLQEGMGRLYSQEFSEYCRLLKESGKCDYFNNAKSEKGLSVRAKKVLHELKLSGPCHAEETIEVCRKNDLCPYEISCDFARRANLIISDYSYVFNPKIKNTFFSRIKKSLENCMLIIDEGHNIPDRVRNIMSTKISTNILNRGIREAEKFRFRETAKILRKVSKGISALAEHFEHERLITTDEFVDLINSVTDYDEFLTSLEKLSDEIREDQRQSYLGSIARFLNSWLEPDEGYVRIISKINDADKTVIISRRCLDPGLATEPVLSQTLSVMMSGTLTPTTMYKNLLGFPEKTSEAEFTSPFPKKNQLILVVPTITTKYSRRNKEEYDKIAQACEKIIKEIPGNIIFFFPSYKIRDDIFILLNEEIKKLIILENSRLTKTEKAEIQKQLSNKTKKRILFGVVSGSFGEGIDIPGNAVKGIVVVGLPLDVPDLETKALIQYYDRKFNKGWEYGYIMPAFNRALQCGGRCIRSEEDKGVIIFLDERYTWSNYSKYFPKDLDIVVTKDFEGKIKGFFEKENK